MIFFFFVENSNIGLTGC